MEDLRHNFARATLPPAMPPRASPTSTAADAPQPLDLTPVSKDSVYPTQENAAPRQPTAAQPTARPPAKKPERCPALYLGPDFESVEVMSYSAQAGECVLSMENLQAVCQEKAQACLDFAQQTMRDLIVEGEDFGNVSL